MKANLLIIFCAISMAACNAQEITLRVAVYDRVTHQPLTGAQVRLQDLASLRDYKIAANDTGIATFEINPEARYRLEVSAETIAGGEEYLSYNSILTYADIHSKKPLQIELEKVKQTEQGMFAAMHFDYNRSSLSTENTASLENLYSTLKNFPSLLVEIGLYADCREAEDMLEKRAVAINTWLDSKAVSHRVVIKQYGTLRPLNACNCSGKAYYCTEEKYAENRRAEFKVLAF